MKQLLITSLIRYVLTGINLYSLPAEELLIGTGLVESAFLRRKQIGGPALGLWQMEPKTHDSLWNDYLMHHPVLAHDVYSLAIFGRPAEGEQLFGGEIPSPYKMVSSDLYACAMARVKYRTIKEKLPASGDSLAMAMYWKKYYNTELGAGTVDEYIAALSNAANTWDFSEYKQKARATA